MKNNKLAVVTTAVTVLYCLLCLVSAGCILYGAFYESHSVFQLGNALVYLWMFNPIVIILSAIGLIRRHEKWGCFALCAALSAISWILAGVMIATVF